MTVYTVIFSNYEELKDPVVVTPGWEYICYTDQPLKSKVWQIKKVSVKDPLISAREYKLTKFPEGCSLWLDASLRINCDLNKFWRNFTSPFTVVSHPWRTCAFREVAACIENKRDDADALFKQGDFYGRQGLPRDNGLIASGILLREDTPEVREFCELWFEQIKLSTRDQIGFAYTEWKLNKYWPRINYDYRTGKYFLFTTHYKRRKNAATYRIN